MANSLQRHSPSLDQKSFFTGRSRSDADDRSDDDAPVRIHHRPAPPIGRPALPASWHVTPLGDYRVSVSSSFAPHARSRSLSLPCAAQEPQSRSRSFSLSSAGQESPLVGIGARQANIDTKHGNVATDTGRAVVDPRFTDLVLFARRGGCCAADVVARFSEKILLPVLRGGGALPREALLDMLHGLAKSQSALNRANLLPDLGRALLGEVVKALGDVDMRPPARDMLEHFAGTLVEKVHGSQASPLLTSLVGSLRAPIDGEGAAHLPADGLLARREAFMSLVCRLGRQWAEADNEGLADFVGAQVRALLDAPRGAHNLHEIIAALAAGSAHLQPEKWEAVAAGLIREFSSRLTGQADAPRHLETVIRSLLGHVAQAGGRPAELAAICSGLAAQGRLDPAGLVTRALRAVLAAPGFALSPTQREAMHRGAQLDGGAAGTTDNPTRPRPASGAQVRPMAGRVPAAVTSERVTADVRRIVAMAEQGATSKSLCKAFDNDVLRPLLRAKPPAGQGALAPGVLAHVLDQLACAYPALESNQPGAGLFDALAGTLFRRLGGHRMREPDSQGVFGFLAGLEQGPHADHRVGLIVRSLGQMRHALGEHRMSPSQLDAYTQAMCQARHQMPHDSDAGFALFAKVHLSGLLGPVNARAPRAASVVDALVRAARRLERPADLVPLAQGLTGAVMEGVSDAAGWRAAVRHASSLWLSSLVARGEVARLTAVCRGVAMQTREANTRAALFGQLDAMAGLAADAKADQMDAMAAGIAICRPGVGMLRQWLVECCDQASARGKPEWLLAAQRVFEAIARKAKLDVTAHEEQLAPTVALAPDPGAVNALMRDMIARAQAGTSPQELAGRFAIEIARYKTPDAAGAVRLRGAGFQAIASRLFAAAGALQGGDPAASPFAALVRALVDAGGGAALGRLELDAVFQQAARLKAKGVVHAQAAENCVHEALFGALRRGAPERPTQAQAVEWLAQVRRFFLAARRPADEDGQLVSAAQALARHSAGLSPAALAFMSAGLVRGVTDLAAHAPQRTRDIVHRHVVDALSRLTIAVAGQTDGRSRLAFVGLGAATAFNDEQRKSSQHVLLEAIPWTDPNVREGLEGWMYALAGRISREAFAQWVATAQASAGPDRGYFSLYAELARYAQGFDKPVASPQLFSAIDGESGMSFTQAFEAVQARLLICAA